MTTNFNISLKNRSWNESGAGTSAFQNSASLANLGITEGTNASLQSVTSGDSGSALHKSVSPGPANCGL
jgi:hypothetical protein